MKSARMKIQRKDTRIMRPIRFNKKLMDPELMKMAQYQLTAEEKLEKEELERKQ